MIFQASIDLEIEDQEIKAVIDVETGIVGFVKVKDETEVDLDYFNSPVEYKVALIKRLEPLYAQKHSVNSKISRKSEAAQILRNYFTKKQ